MNRLAALGAVLLAIFAAGPGWAQSWTFDIAGVPRTTEIFVPLSAADRPRPLVIVLHGLGGDGERARRIGFDLVAEREGFLVAYPNGIDKRWDYGRQLNRPMPDIDGRTVDDVAFFDALIARAVADKNVDPKRVYLAGTSNGGLMAHRMACAMNRELAAVASYISGMTNWQAQVCRRDRAVPILILAGTGDTFQSYSGTSGNQNGYLLSVPNTVAIWQLRNGCKTNASEDFPDLDPADGTRVGIVRYNDCTDGAEVWFFRVFGAGHRLPTRQAVDIAPHPQLGRTNRDIETAEETWTFFKRFRLN